VAKQDFPTIS